jgi:hypothetical protein
MPGFDGTGPAGMGPMTGGGRGYCAPYGPRYRAYGPYRAAYPVPTRSPYPYGLGRRRWGLGGSIWGRGRGLGWGRGFGPGRGRGW